jgi:hypothetical protein
MAVMIDKETKEAVPFTAFVNGERLAKDIARVNDAAGGRFRSVLGMALALMRNYDSFRAPKHFRLLDLMQKFDKTFGATGRDYGKVSGERTVEDISKRRSDRWNFLFVAGMWFQDLFNYDFRRTEMCVIPYGTQEGEISFCAYNTGIGWRNIIEKMHMTATLSTWYGEHGRHKIYAGGRQVEQITHLSDQLHINAEHAARGAQVSEGPQNAREEKIAQRDRKLAEAREKGRQLPSSGARAHKPSTEEEARLMKMYRQEVLKEPAAPSLVQIGGGASAERPRETVGASGD